MGLDAFLPPYVAKQKKTPEMIVVQEVCCKCNATIPLTEPLYRLTIKGKTGVYCIECKNKVFDPMRPKEDTDG